MSDLLRYVPICLELKNLVKATRRLRRVILITNATLQILRFYPMLLASTGFMCYNSIIRKVKV